MKIPMTCLFALSSILLCLWKWHVLKIGGETGRAKRGGKKAEEGRQGRKLVSETEYFLAYFPLPSTCSGIILNSSLLLNIHSISMLIKDAENKPSG